jgi:hypothetical protein
MIAPQDPPGFVVRTEAQKAASNNGFRSERGTDAGWLCFQSTTVPGVIWVAGASAEGPWLLSIGRPEVALESGLMAEGEIVGPGAKTIVIETLHGLYEAIERVYRLSLSLPNAPLVSFHTATRNMPNTTEAERLVVQRIGQDIFRQALLAYWDGRCPLTGITETRLLRASHIVAWAQCTTDEHRLDVHNGLLLSALWDAAFDSGLVSFADDGTVIGSDQLSDAAKMALGWTEATKLRGLTGAHVANLQQHRKHHGF